MAVCKTCNYPYVGKGSCPNCGEKSPIKTTLFGLLFIGAIIWGVIYFLGGSQNYNDYNEKESVTTTMDDNSSNEQYSDTSQIDQSISQDPNISDEPQSKILTKEDNYNYSCRECGKQIKWVGAYAWSNRDSTDVVNFHENTDLRLVGDSRVDTEMHHEYEYSNRGVFCSITCAEKNFDDWLILEN